MTTDKKIFIETAKLFLGVPYRWGGDDYRSIDCSGLVLECLKSIGYVAEDRDTTANGLWLTYKDKEVIYPETGDLIFWFNLEGKATHVAICYEDEYCITADGGGRTTLTLDDAIKQNAFVKYRPITHRKSKPRFIRIF